VNAVAPTLEAFFTERLMNQRQASPHTIASYRDTCRLLLAFAEQHNAKPPSALDFADLDAPTIAAFLDHLENGRGNSIRSRNSRLAAVHSLYRFAAHPEHAALIARVLAIPSKRFDRTDVSFLTNDEVDALLAAPDRTRWVGRRDHALLALAIQTGLRVSELAGLRCRDVELSTGPHVRCLGKGRKNRSTPLTAATVTILDRWMRERDGAAPDPLFPTSRGNQLSRDAIALLVTRHARTATATCPTLKNKNISPHVLRHTCAMALLHSGVDPTVIALWLGHEQTRTTDLYVHADLTLKNGPWPERHHQASSPAATTPPTSSSPSSTACDYADPVEPVTASQQAITAVLGINASSALRMDITGARWGLHGAEAVLKLRALRSNGDLDTYWAFHLDHEHRRVHQTRYLNSNIQAAA